MRVVSYQKLCELHKNPQNIRNICIVAHVDHGKTTLADSLVASNGVISTRMAGKLRYMDSRKDEQERGITMKSSSIALFYATDENEYLVNLIDSPGHVDFSSEVSTAVRLCDGAIVVVDVVEGVCPQTQVALKQSWQENIKPVLVLNKVDRLILEMKLTPLDAYVHLTQVLEQVNAVMGELFATDVLSRSEKESAQIKENESSGLYDWGDGLDKADDSTLYFSPNQGNVIFASAIDGWGFSVHDFARLYSKKLGLNEDNLRRTLWGDFYYNAKTKRIMKGAQEKAKKPLFVQLVLENIWSLYDTICVRKDKEKLVRIVEQIGVQLATRDLRHTDPKVQLQAVCSQWLPLSSATLDMVCKILPAANQLNEEKVEKLMCSNNQTLENYPEETQALKKAFLDCSSAPAAPVIVFVSKMFPIDRKLLPQNKPRVFTDEEIAQRREAAKLRHAAKMAGKLDTNEETDASPSEECVQELTDDAFIAFARVYSGVLKKGLILYVLGPKHVPQTTIQQIKNEGDIDINLTLKDLKAGHHVTKVMISDIFLMMGRELENLEEAPAGSIVGIGGLEEHVLKSATLSTEICCPSFSELNLMAVPILRVAVEPAKPSDLPALIKGLKLLNQADACVQVFVQETGEHVLVTAGEVHLERCLDDLKNRYAKVDINASAPIIPFRETVVPPPTVDMVNELIQDQPHLQKKLSVIDESVDSEGIVTVTTPNKQSTIRILCSPLPKEVTELLEKHNKLIKLLDSYTNNKNVGELVEDFDNLNLNNNTTVDSEGAPKRSDKHWKDILTFKEDLNSALKQSGGIWAENNFVNKIWSFGPRRCGPNMLVNEIEDYQNRNVWNVINAELMESKLIEYDSSFINGFQLATLAGPLCEEPMMGVAYFIKDWTIDDVTTVSTAYGPLSGQIMSAVKDGCRRSFQAQPQRLMAAMYTCNIQANSEVLGKMYAVLGRRQGRVLSGDMTQGSASFTVTAVLPVIESFHFAQEIRKQTSGLASPQLVFSHWEVIDIDPFWSPSTEEEYLHYGEKADTENRARQYMNSVRRRKGLSVEEKIVQHAEKQRTLSKNK
ncbi:elongation factor-like GTPase 1 isoform X2 [Rhodnius prolixus]|uniref:elongation factor-like GTPase 1 isoform X2 n=1 Tax=Rhodnius prolixus TaxID=13249 RepID=UPI003D18D097